MVPTAGDEGNGDAREAHLERADDLPVAGVALVSGVVHRALRVVPEGQLRSRGHREPVREVRVQVSCSRARASWSRSTGSRTGDSVGEGGGAQRDRSGAPPTDFGTSTARAGKRGHGGGTSGHSSVMCVLRVDQDTFRPALRRAWDDSAASGEDSCVGDPALDPGFPCKGVGGGGGGLPRGS